MDFSNGVHPPPSPRVRVRVPSLNLRMYYSLGSLGGEVFLSLDEEWNTLRRLLNPEKRFGTCLTTAIRLGSRNV